MKDYKNTKCVYIAGKLNDDAVGYLFNVHSLMELAEEARKAGYAYFCPAIDLLMGIKFAYTDYHEYFDNSQPWIARADAVLLNTNWKTSAGTKKEIEWAVSNGVPVFESIKDMDEYFGMVEAEVIPETEEVNGQE